MERPLLQRARQVAAREGRLVLRPARWVGLGAVSGVLAGVSSFVFLAGLELVTETRLAHPWLLYLLPLAGLAIGSAYHYLGGRSARGVGLLIDEIHEPTEWVPRRMAPLVLVGTWTTHLFGGSAGREGTALQMSGSLSDVVARVFGLDEHDRRVLLIAALAGGFGAVFGVPMAGTVFALEVQSIGRLQFDALVPALTAAIVGDRVCRALGARHAVRTPVDMPLDVAVLLKVVVAGVAFGLAGTVFAVLTHRLKSLLARHVGWPPLRPVLGGLAIVGLATVFGRAYLGLSLPLADEALAGVKLSFAVFALKLLFTAVTLGSGFLYAISRLGVTGVRDQLADGAEEMVRRIRGVTDMPVALGFGISRPEHVREVNRWADAAVVGSALVNVIAEAGTSPELESRVEEYVRWLRS